MRRPRSQRLATLQFSSPFVRRALRQFSKPLRHRDIRILAGTGAGLRINLHGSALAFATGTAERPVQAVLQDHIRAGSTVYDIGANVGFMTLIAARLVGPQGCVLAFEPVPENAAAIRGNVRLNQMSNVDVREVAVAASSGTARLLVSGWSAFSRLDSASIPQDVTRELEVKLTSVDELVAGGAPPPDVVKIDVEGAELDVIEGMRTTLREIRPLVVCEMHDRNRDYVALMSSIEYDVINLDEDVPVEEGHRNAHTLARPRD